MLEIWCKLVVKLFKGNQCWKTSTKSVLPSLRKLQSPNLIYKALQNLTEYLKILQKCFKNYRLLQNLANAANLCAALKTESLFNLVCFLKWKSLIFHCRFSIVLFSREFLSPGIFKACVMCKCKMKRKLGYFPR